MMQAAEQVHPMADHLLSSPDCAQLWSGVEAWRSRCDHLFQPCFAFTKCSVRYANISGHSLHSSMLCLALTEHYVTCFTVSALHAFLTKITPHKSPLSPPPSVPPNIAHAVAPTFFPMLYSHGPPSWPFLTLAIPT